MKSRSSDLEIDRRRATWDLPNSRADVVELVDTLDLGSSAERRGGSSPLIRTKNLVDSNTYPIEKTAYFRGWVGFLLHHSADLCHLLRHLLSHGGKIEVRNWGGTAN